MKIWPNLVYRLVAPINCLFPWISFHLEKIIKKRNWNAFWDLAAWEMLWRILLFFEISCLFNSFVTRFHSSWHYITKIHFSFCFSFRHEITWHSPFKRFRSGNSWRSSSFAWSIFQRFRSTIIIVRSRSSKIPCGSSRSNFVSWFFIVKTTRLRLLEITRSSQSHLVQMLSMTSPWGLH